MPRQLSFWLQEWLAALAMSLDYEMTTFDRGFKSFRDLTLRLLENARSLTASLRCAGSGGILIGPLDTLIGARALSLAATLVTQHREFTRIDALRVEDWIAT